MERKVTYEQSVALELGRKTARANQRQRVTARVNSEQQAADLARETANHIHRWGNYEYTDNYTTETRTCQCGACETRPVRL